jgi:hypothetical protein
MEFVKESSLGQALGQAIRLGRLLSTPEKDTTHIVTIITKTGCLAHKTKLSN